MQLLGNLHLFLGIQVSSTAHGLFLNQTKYATNLLQKTIFLEFKPTSTFTVYETSTWYPLYLILTCICRGLLWAHCSLAIFFVVNFACQAMHQPTDHDFMDVKCIFRYIKGTIDHGLHLIFGILGITTCTDNNWATDSKDRQSVTGSRLLLGSNPIFWVAKK